MNLPRSLAGFFVCAATLVLACAAQAAPVPQVGQPAILPELSTAGGHLAPEAMRGKVIVLAWFASYCPFCAQEAPKLQKLYAANAQHLLVVGVNVEEKDPDQAAKVGQWIARYGWTFPVALNAAALERTLGKPKGIPALVVIDAEGRVRQVESGELLDGDFDDIAAFARHELP
jgi:thiol-disulfide isomerase/thioredoxin